MSWSELDFAIMTQVNALRMHANDAPSDNAGKDLGQPLIMSTFTLYMVCLLANWICSACFLHTIGKDHLVNLHSFVADSDVTERMHGNTKPNTFCTMPHLVIMFTLSSWQNLIVPEGLDLKRQWYPLKIRPFCWSNLAADLTCPNPLERKTTSHDSTKTIEKQAKANGKRSCSICQQPGHAKWTCPTQ